jgi:glucose-1-phosphate cytidylyltransferase
MKAVILAGGLGTRLSEETSLKPKPMVEIGGMPILWHIMKNFSHYGVDDFIICLGYKGYLIKEFFQNYKLHTSDLIIDFEKNKSTFLNTRTEPWTVTMIDTGKDTMTGGRLKRVKDFLNDDEPFFFTYGDGLSNININELLKTHIKSKKNATVSAVYPPGRFGALEINKENSVINFIEKPEGDGGMINGGFFVLEKEVLDLINSDGEAWEDAPLKNLAQSGNLSAHIHKGFWQPMDTLRDKHNLQALWDKDQAPWKVW